jgi:hypothetical protein
MTVPTVGATPNKSNYQQGEAVSVTFTITDAPVDQATTRAIDWSGHDGEGNVVTGTLSIVSHSPKPDTFVLDFVKWRDTGVAFTVNGLQATSVA